MKKRMISLLLGLGLLCSVAACGQTDTAGDLSGMAGVTASSTTSAVQTPEQTLKATQTPEPSVQTTQTPAQEKTQKPEKTTKATAKPKATKKATAKPKVTKKPQNNADSSATVYITDTGKKYHRAGCRSLAKSKHAISRANAKARGYSPCRVCKP